MARTEPNPIPSPVRPKRAIRAAPSLAITSIFAVAISFVMTPAGAQRARFEPEAATGRGDKRLVTASRHMIVAANPLAAEAGRAMLRAGGGAIDATIAAQLVLGLVEPQSSGLGGGGFLLHWSEAARTVRSYDGRETAPATAGADRFLANGLPMAFPAAVKSGLSVGTPGLAAMLDQAHRDHGRLPWARLFEPAIRLAEQGFAISPRLARLLALTPRESFAPPARAYFFDTTGRPLAVGHTLKNPAYAATLRAIAKDRSRALHDGPLATAIATAVASASPAGDLAPGDLAAYRAKERAPACGNYRGYRICAMGPPSSGAHTVLQTLALMAQARTADATASPHDTHALHLIAEAEKLAFADRNHFLADPDFVAPPPGLLAPRYLAARARLIDPRRAMAGAEPGDPSGLRASHGRDATVEGHGTTHLSVVDGEGNAVSLTSSIEGAFGAGLMAGGFLLNNQLTDFSFHHTDAAGRPIANRVEAGKRPRSSMTPTLVFDPEGRLFAVLGSPGGSRIILYVVKAIVGLIDWRLDAQATADLANFGSRGGRLELEQPKLQLPSWSGLRTPATTTAWQAMRLRAYGHTVGLDTMTSGLAVIVRRGNRLEGGADPRREGIVLGD